MKNRKSLFLLSLLVVLLVAANVAVRRGISRTKAVGRRSLIEHCEDVCGIRLDRTDAPTVELSRSGRRWRLLAPYAGSVDEQVVMKFLDTLAATPITEVIFDSSLLKLGRTRADFSLAEPPLRVSLSTEKGDVESVAFGAVTPLPGGVYVSVDGLDSVFIVPSNVLEVVNVDAERFRRRALVTVGPESIASIGIKRGAEPVIEFTRGDSGWRIRDAAVSAQKVQDLLVGLTSAEAKSFVWPVGASNETAHASTALLVGYGLDPDAAVTVTLKCGDGVDRRVSFGKESAKDSVYALVHGGAAIVTVPAALKGLADQEEGAFTDSRLFPVESKSVGTFSVADKDVLYAFNRGKDGGWSIESPIVAKAADEAVDALLSRILSLSASDAVPSGGGVSVSIATNAEKAVVSASSVFGNASPEDFRSKEIMRIDPARVKRIVRTSGDSTPPVAVVYDRERKAWDVESGIAGGLAGPGGIEAVLSAVNPLVTSRVVKLRVAAADLDDFGLDSPFLTVAIDQDVDGAVRRNIMIGKPTKGGRFATVGSSDAVFIIGEKSLELLSSDLSGK